jgi:hypothetical protein
VTVSFSDSASHTVTSSTTLQADGSWSLSTVDLHPLTDGPLTVTATTRDLAGNPASASDHDTLDTFAAIAISSDGSVAGVYNQADSRAVIVSGNVTGVEAGQTVIVTFMDAGSNQVSSGSSVNSDGSWSAPAADLSSLENGPLTVTATTEDRAGNPASASNSDTLNTLVRLNSSVHGLDPLGAGDVLTGSDTRSPMTPIHAISTSVHPQPGDAAPSHASSDLSEQIARDGASSRADTIETIKFQIPVVAAVNPLPLESLPRGMMHPPLEHEPSQSIVPVEPLAGTIHPSPPWIASLVSAMQAPPSNGGLASHSADASAWFGLHLSGHQALLQSLPGSEVARHE